MKSDRPKQPTSSSFGRTLRRAVDFSAAAAVHGAADRADDGADRWLRGRTWRLEVTMNPNG